MKTRNQALAEARQRRHLSQRQAARAIGISRQYLGMIEAGKRNGTLRVWRKMAAVYGVTLDSLLFGLERHESCPCVPGADNQEVKPSGTDWDTARAG